MAKHEEQGIDEVIRCLKVYGPATFHVLLAALLIWLFGVLVFIPIAKSINRITGLFCSLVIFVAFSILIYKSISGFQKTIDAFSALLAKKYVKRLKIKLEQSITLFKNAAYIIFTLILYLFYLPLLINLHPAVSGIVLILILLWILFLALKILSIFSPKILDWLSKEE